MRRPLTIVHVNDIASVATTIAAEQRRRGHRASVTELPKPGAGWPFPWKLVTVPLRLVLAARSAVGIRAQRPDIVHVHYATQGFVGLMAGRPYVVHCHGSDVRDVAPSSLRGRYLRRVMRGAILVLAATPDLLPWAAGLRRDAEYLPNPIDTHRFVRSGEPDTDVLLAVRLDPVKGAATAIGTLAGILARRPQTTATVVASGSMVEAARTALGDRVRYIDPVAHDAMPELIGRHRVAIGQFHLAALGQLELETMAVGIPVATYVRHRPPGADPPPIVQAKDADAAAGSLVRLLDDAAERAAIGRQGRAWVEQHHAASNVADRLDTFYERALQRAAPVRRP